MTLDQIILPAAKPKNEPEEPTQSVVLRNKQGFSIKKCQIQEANNEYFVLFVPNQSKTFDADDKEFVDTNEYFDSFTKKIKRICNRYYQEFQFADYDRCDDGLLIKCFYSPNIVFLDRHYDEYSHEDAIMQFFSAASNIDIIGELLVRNIGLQKFIVVRVNYIKES